MSLIGTSDLNWPSDLYGFALGLPRTGLFKEVILENMPDPNVASESIWLPFLRKCLGILQM